MKPTIEKNIKQAIREKFAWPGGYPLYIILSDGEALCTTCARQEYRRLVQSTKDQDYIGWRPIAADINWEDEALFCCHCDKLIESAYTEL